MQTTFFISAAALLTRHRAYLPSLGAEKAAPWRQQTTGAMREFAPTNSAEEGGGPERREALE